MPQLRVKTPTRRRNNAIAFHILSRKRNVLCNFLCVYSYKNVMASASVFGCASKGDIIYRSRCHCARICRHIARLLFVRLTSKRRFFTSIVTRTHGLREAPLRAERRGGACVGHASLSLHTKEFAIQASAVTFE